MRISDFTCAACASVYEVAESLSAEGRPGRDKCVVCGKVLESWQEPKLRAYRLVMPLEYKYKPMPAPPSPRPPPSPSIAPDLRAGSCAISYWFRRSRYTVELDGYSYHVLVREEDRLTWV